MHLTLFKLDLSLSKDTLKRKKKASHRLGGNCSKSQWTHIQNTNSFYKSIRQLTEKWVRDENRQFTQMNWPWDWWKHVPALKTLGTCNSNKISLTQPRTESDSYKGHRTMCGWQYGALELTTATRGNANWYKNRGSCLEAIPFLGLALEVGLAHGPGDMDKNRYRSTTGISTKHLTTASG